MGKGKTSQEIHEEVTSRVIESLKHGEIPWHKPWISMGGHKNYVSKKNYRGINPFLCQMSAMTNGFESPYWVSFKQAGELSAKKYLKENKLTDTKENRKAYYADKEAYKGVRKGEKSTLIIFWKQLKIKDDENVDENGKSKTKIIPLLKYLYVFNTDQTDLEIPLPKIDKDKEFNPIEEAEELIENWADKPPISHGGDRACYIPSLDQIEMPPKNSFDTDEFYYKTLFHESTHATGHESRINRKFGTGFGSDPYAKEELVAELGASMLMNYVGIENKETETNTEAYIKHWIQRFEEEPKLIVSAGGQAQKAMDYITGEEYEPTPNPNEEKKDEKELVAA